MKYAKDTRPKGVSHKAAEVLVEALPWIKNITGKTVVIKYGGSAKMCIRDRVTASLGRATPKRSPCSSVVVRG